MAKHFYLNELQKLNLVTPSIALPYPKRPFTDEKFLIHSAHRRIQSKKIADTKRDIESLKLKGLSPCYKTLKASKRRLWYKVTFLKKKFNPDSKEQNIQKKMSDNQRKKKNKKSKERYAARKFRKKLEEYASCVDGRNVFNISSIDLPIVDFYALQYGHGFVLVPNNKMKEEEILLLESFRFLDRLGKADKRLSSLEERTIVERSFMSQKELPVTGEYGNDVFLKNDFIPDDLQILQPAEHELTCINAKFVKKEFEELNNKVISSLQTIKRRKFNIPKVVRSSILKLKKLVNDKVIDIRKVDKGQVILIIDYEQRIAAESENIAKIASLCPEQKSNWKENKLYVEESMKILYCKQFLTKNEMVAVTGLIPGGSSGKLKNKNGSMKFTHMLSQKELFAQQKIPYVYPYFKAHKVPFQSLLKVKPAEVHSFIPSRLVVGMKNCQMSRVQRWLENILSPLSKLFGKFEYIKDSTDFLIKFDDVKSIAKEESWNWQNMILFTVDVKALYPSVKIKDVEKSLRYCFDKCTNWDETVKCELIDLISYTLKNQQIYWQDQYYMLCQGIPTGGKHSVPLANILLSYIIIFAFDRDPEFLKSFDSFIKLWVRFIDDCMGIFMGGIEEFALWFAKLQIIFREFDLELTCDTETHYFKDNIFIEKHSKVLTFLDMDIFKYDGSIHTKEHRKETSAESYLYVTSAHAKHSFAGIVKSQLYRLRRLCSQQSDFEMAVDDLKIRCLKSGYDVKMVDGILGHGKSLKRMLLNKLSPATDIGISEKQTVRLVILSGTPYEKCFTDFAKRMNGIPSTKIIISIVRTTGPTLGQLLFNNANPSQNVISCSLENCVVCKNDIEDKSGVVFSSTTKRDYKLGGRELTCNDGGIYVVTADCNAQYTGKTVNFGQRLKEHLQTSKQSSIYAHKQTCDVCFTLHDFKVTFVESYQDRGKYTLSEREFLWNWRIRGSINLQKTLKA